ncbi:hypothetical protein ACFVT6_31080 [Streptomyces sp. NPDC058049]|uniref:hypothetical protein n=1 Tax=Streptomyces sp. NPDC058049 TaxID=3346314 RepID=UPI0036E3A15A
MKASHACGPERDPEFFGELDKLFAQYPEAAHRYAVTCLRVELEVLKIDFSKQVGVSRIDDGRIITEFYDRDDPTPRRGDQPGAAAQAGRGGRTAPARMCCGWIPSKGCTRQCEE